MKKITLLLIALMIPNVSFALNCSESKTDEEVTETRELKTDVPKYLEGATITVRLADGRETVVPAEKFKVVPRIQQFLITKTATTSSKVCTPEKNRLSVGAGRGPLDKVSSNKSQAPNKVTVENEVGAIGALQYSRLTDVTVFDKPLSVSIQGQTNESALLLLGVDF